MRFDDYNEVSIPNGCTEIGGNNGETQDCPTDIPPADPLPEVNHLVLKPEQAVKEVGDFVEYKAYLVNDQGVESQLQQGLTFRSSDTGIAVIGASSGYCQCVSSGVVTISVEWDNLIAFAQLEVTLDCAAVKVGMVVCVDNSISMNQVFTQTVTPGNPAYATRLSLAKDLAKRHIREVNESKDIVGLVSFNSSAEELGPITSDKGSTEVLVDFINATSQKTCITCALEKAIEMLDASTADLKVVVLLTDGEDSISTTDPEVVAEQFKSRGGYIVGVGARAHGAGFLKLKNICSEGLFLNALPSNTAETIELFSGLKGFFCAGNCNPSYGYGQVLMAVGQLNYDGFEKWDVVGGYVDLIGGFEEWPRNRLFDFLPGNGLYVDLAGSGDPWTGKLKTKTPIALVSGKTYELRVKLAGNQREETETFQVRMKVVGATIDEEQIVTLDDWRQQFVEYRLNFVASASEDVNVEFQMVSKAAQPAFWPFGALLDSVIFRNQTDATNLLIDIFDGENGTYVDDPCDPPPPGPNDCMGYGCLEEPPPDQLEDDDPLPVVES